jgi:hypothetical protein
MSKAAKFIVIINDNISRMEDKAILFYSNLFGELGEKYASENLSSASFKKIQNDFLIEILAIGEDKNPLSFLKVDSRRLSNQNLGANKAIRVSDVVYFGSEDLTLLLNRAEEVAVQRKHDLIWIEAFEIDFTLIETLQFNHYQKFNFEQETANNIYPKRIYFRKQVNQTNS